MAVRSEFSRHLNQYVICPKYIDCFTFCFAGDSMTMADSNIATSHGMPFSTYDKYNGPIPSCTSWPYDNGGWWFNKCRYSYLNGFWRDTYWVWYPIAEFKGDERGTLMMIRPN